MEEHYLKVIEDDVICLDCTGDENFKVNINIKDEDSKFQIDGNGLQIKDADVNININSKGASGENDEVKATIDSSGISITTKDN